MATVQVTEQNFEATVKHEVIRKVQALDMDEVRRSVEEQERDAPRAAKGGGV